MNVVDENMTLTRNVARFDNRIDITVNCTHTSWTDFHTEVDGRIAQYLIRISCWDSVTVKIQCNSWDYLYI